MQAAMQPPPGTRAPAPAAAALELQLKGDLRFFIETCLYVRHIDTGEAIPFQLTDSQRVVADEVQEGLNRKETVRIAVLKSRRSLISSLCEAIGYWFTSSGSGRNGAIIADTDERSQLIFQLVEQYYADDQRRVVGLRPPVMNSNVKELRFGNPDRKARLSGDGGLRSGLRILSAEAKNPGMGGTYLFVHASEVPYWPEGAPIWKSVGIALSKAPGTVAIMEGTANGQGGLFYDTYRRARAGPGASPNKERGRNEWTAIFLPWWMDRRNRTPPLGADELSRFDYESGDERRYAERWKLSPEQVVWRRRIIAGPECFKPGVAPIDVFRQEYPADDDEAFLSSGKHFFLLPKVKELEEDPEKGVKPPLQVGEIVQDGPSLEERGPHRRVPVKPVFVKQEDGALRVWEWPKKGTPYLVICDPAEGLAERDPAAIGVLDRARFRWVAAWTGTHLSSRQLAWSACLLGWWYEHALLAIEHNNMGVATIEEARRIMYPRLWHHVDVTRPGSDPSEKIGWLTTPATRQYALNNLEGEIRGKAMGQPIPDFYDQCRDFMWPQAKGGTAAATTHQGPRARPGKHDEWVMLTAIGLAVHMAAGVPHVVLPDAQPPPAGTQLHPVHEPVKIEDAFKPKRRIKGNSMWGY